MFKQLNSDFLVSSPIMAASCLKFCSIALSLVTVICIFNSEEFIYGTFADFIGLCSFDYCSFILESLLDKTAVTMAILQKCLDTFLS